MKNCGYKNKGRIMGKKTIKVGFHSAFTEQDRNYYINILKDKFEPVITEDYDYYFAGEAIYWNHENMKELLHSNIDAIRIMVCGEAVYPDLNLFDYALWHWGYYQAEDRVISTPLLLFEENLLIDKVEDIDHTKDRCSLDLVYTEKTKFCNFIYSNPKSHFMRDTLFFEISKYKKVDSLGSHLKNVEIEDSRYEVGWERKSVELKKPYKFSIAAENACFPGYTSEKIMSSMLANSIPIYWGNPYVAEEFNTESFINVNDYKSIDDVIKRIEQLDNDKNSYLEVLSKPWRTTEQIKRCQEAIDAYIPSLMHIFEQDKNEAKRRPRGCWSDYIYAPFLENSSKSISQKNILHRINKKLKRT